MKLIALLSLLIIGFLLSPVSAYDCTGDNCSKIAQIAYQIAYPTAYQTCTDSENTTHGKPYRGEPFPAIFGCITVDVPDICPKVCLGELPLPIPDDDLVPEICKLPHISL